MIRRRHLLQGLLLLFILLSPLFRLTAEETKAPRDRICLWEVRSDKGTLYLLGSVHLLKEEHYPLDSRITDAYAGSDVIVFETDIGVLNSTEVQSMLLARALYADGRTLVSELPEDLYRGVGSILEQMGLTSEAFDTFRPWFVGVTISTLSMMQSGYNPDLGIDQYFYRLAAEEGKPILGLETAEFQIEILASMSDEDQIDFLRQTLDEFETVPDMMEEIVQAWRRGNVKKIDRLNESLDEYPSLYDRLLVERNGNWLNRMEEMLNSDETHLVVVGAAHMPGPDGILAGLKERGYRVTQF